MSEISRNLEILKMYKEGKTLEEIGTVFNFTRSRAQQIVVKEIKKEILVELNIYRVTPEEKKLLSFAVKEELHNIYLQNKNKKWSEKSKKIIEEIKIKMSKIPSYTIFSTVSSYTQAVGVKQEILKKYFPDIIENIYSREKFRWSSLYNKCRNCGTTSVKHSAHGLCHNCWTKSNIFKDIQEASRLRNSDNWKKRQAEYSREYQKRPEVIAKARYENDKINFSGNRENAIKRDGEKCSLCGLSRDESLKKFNRDLYVKHINGCNNNLENLRTVCLYCFKKNKDKNNLV